MTEAEWLKSMNGRAMIEALRGKGSDRLWRLYLLACVRGLENSMLDPASRRALDVAERYADGNATIEELRAARIQAEDAAKYARLEYYFDEARVNFSARGDERYEALGEASRAASAVVFCLADEIEIESCDDDGLLLPEQLREVFGNPFRWREVDPVWLARNDATAEKLARSIYEDRTFDLLPILADALEDAGCTDDTLLSHLRSPGPHVRGCWALDHILERG